MTSGLFGKLPARRDFVTVNVSRGFLELWEGWAQSGLTASREKLGEAWDDAWLGAPLWRFWLGPGLCGGVVMGAMMPSLDGVGRHYPLTLVHEGDAPPPDMDLHESWFDAAENFLLATLDEGASYERALADLATLPEPEANGAPGAPPSVRFEVYNEAPSAATFDALRRKLWRDLYSRQSFWWTIGGETRSPAALTCSGMPDPALFSSLLTGDFGPAPTNGPSNE